jgi:hypothetical protein
MTNVFPKDPDARLDYQWDWSEWLAEGETITDAVITVPDGITLDEQIDADTTVTAWLIGGTDEEGYKLTCHIETSAGREDDRSIYINVRER